jgi:hypothetical protein
VGLGFGIAALLVSLWFSALSVHQRPLQNALDYPVLRRMPWRAMSAAIAAMAIWEIAAVAVFDASVGRWLTLVNGILIASWRSAG